MEHLTETLIDNDEENGFSLQEEILEQFRSGLKKQPWTLIKANKLKKLYRDWSRGILDKELLEDCLSIAIENLQKIIINGYILHYTDEISEEELDRWNEFIADEYGYGRYTEQIERFSDLAVKLTTAKTDEQKMIALDTVLGTVHGIGSVARWFVEGGEETLDEISEWREIEHLSKQQPKEMKHLTKSPKIPKILEPLACEARKYPDFEEFAKAFSVDCKHGLYYHVTSDPNFYIDPEKGPRDMSSLAYGEEAKGKLMITSDLGLWSFFYKERPYVAIIDMCDVPKDQYWQVNRGFGNEFFVNDPSKAKVVAVISKKAAYMRDRRYHEKLPRSKEELRIFWEKVWEKEHLT